MEIWKVPALTVSYVVAIVQMKLMRSINDGSRILIFTETKRGADDLTRALRQDGLPALAIHGDKRQNERDWVLDQFRQGRQNVMVATNVAARGLGKSGIAGIFRRHAL